MKTQKPERIAENKIVRIESSDKNKLDKSEKSLILVATCMPIPQGPYHLPKESNRQSV